MHPFIREQRSSFATKIILAAWIVVVGINSQKIFNPVQTVPVEQLEAEEAANSGPANDELALSR